MQDDNQDNNLNNFDTSMYQHTIVQLNEEQLLFIKKIKKYTEYYFSDQNLTDDMQLMDNLIKYDNKVDIKYFINTYLSSKLIFQVKPTKAQVIQSLTDSKLVIIIEQQYIQRYEQFDIQSICTRQLRVYGFDIKLQLQIIKQLTNSNNPNEVIVPEQCRETQYQQLFKYSVVTFKTEEEADTIYSYFGNQSDFNQKKMKQIKKMKIKSQDIEQQKQFIIKNLVVLRSKYSLKQQIEETKKKKSKKIKQNQVENVLQNNQKQVQTMILSLKQFCWSDNLQNNKYCIQLISTMTDILQKLPADQLFTSILDCLQQRFINILDCIEDLQTVTTTNKYQWDQITQYINSFSNSILNKVNIALEIRMFCFGKSMLPLPVYQLRNRVLQNRGSPFTIVQSSTGSGKTTLFPAFLTQLPQVKINRMKIFITQPTSLTVRQIAKTIDEKIICGLYSISKIPYESADICVCTPLQIIKLITKNPEIIKTSMFVLDEFHTRTIALDVLFAKLIENKQYLTQPYQFVMMSATPDQDIIKQLPEKEESNLIMKIENCSPFKITQIRVKANTVKDAVTTVPATQALEFINEILTKQKPVGNIICFTSGKRECEDICEYTSNGLKNNSQILCIDFAQFKNLNLMQVHDKLRKISEKAEKLIVVPIIMAGQATELEKTFASDPIPNDFAHKCIKVIAATNIAETSITIEDLICLIDSGMFKEASWDENKGIRTLKEKQISASQRTQRIGRVGRVRDGFAYLIDLDASRKVETQKPEIQRIDLKQIILELKNIDIHLENIYATLPTKPDMKQLANALNMLQTIKAIDEFKKITEKGKRLLEYQDISPFNGCIFEELLQKSKIDLVISIIAYCITANSSELINNNVSSALAQQNFVEESDAATLVKCFLCIENIPQKQQKTFCIDNGFIFSTYVQSRRQVQQIFDSVVQNNIKTYEIEDEDSSDAETNVTSNVPYIEDIFHKFLLTIQDNLILPALDNYVLTVNNLSNSIQSNSAQKQQAHLNTITNVISKPRYIFNGSSLLSETENIPIYYFDRPGTNQVVSYSHVYFFDIQCNESYNMYIGRYMHRMPDSYKQCYSVQIPKNSFRLPYLKLLIDKFFNDGQNIIFKQLIQGMNINGSSNSTYFAECLDKEHMFFVTQKQLPLTQQVQLVNTLIKLIEIAAKCPSTLISRYKALNNYYVEFFQKDSYSDAQFFLKSANEENKPPFAYELNKDSLLYLIDNNFEYRISFVFDLSMNTSNFSYSHYQCDRDYSGDTVIKLKQNETVSQLIIISDKQLALKKLRWFDAGQSSTYYSGYVTEDYKFNRVAKNCIKGIFIHHSENEILFQQQGSSLYQFDQIDQFITKQKESNIIQEKIRKLQNELYNNIDYKSAKEYFNQLFSNLKQNYKIYSKDQYKQQFASIVQQQQEKMKQFEQETKTIDQLQNEQKEILNSINLKQESQNLSTIISNFMQEYIQPHVIQDRQIPNIYCKTQKQNQKEFQGKVTQYLQNICQEQSQFYCKIINGILHLQYLVYRDRHFFRYRDRRCLLIEPAKKSIS
ncbi:Pre-mRNA_splicing factor RNA helicase [Hexamita inflata]|uniref:Pre-mRNA splicing factor RNA helicase n=1 Tax=Hexamita inflata TaxID=28002 RepID=A0AA86V2N7_9EUKA|nr:Pre-mRNA splicing factor RNA helicase [Hexamita inflata]